MCISLRRLPITRERNILKKNRFLRFFVSAFVILISKLILQDVFERLSFDPYVAYATVHFFVFFISYFIHLKFTFRQTLSFKSLLQYFQMVFVFKLIDYVVFAGAFAFFEVSSKIAILSATLILFLIRFSALDKRFRPAPKL
jgi:hypothetical protein